MTQTTTVDSRVPPPFPITAHQLTHPVVNLGLFDELANPCGELLGLRRV